MPSFFEHTLAEEFFNQGFHGRRDRSIQERKKKEREIMTKTLR
jgi:hypothetical protein